MAEVTRRNRELADVLLGLTADALPYTPEMLPQPQPARQAPRDANVIVAHIEINDHHGVGVLLERLFRSEPDIVSFRSRDFYGGRQDFGSMHACLAHQDDPRDAVVWSVLQAMRGGSARRVLSVPYFSDDALTAIALKEAFGAPLCTFLMDDQNLHIAGIPDAVMNELLSKSSLRLAISPQMCEGYEAKYRRQMWFMPPLAPTRLIPLELNRLCDNELSAGQPLVLGNIWGQRWVTLLRETVRGSGVSLKWHNNGQFPWLPCSKDDLARDGILPQDGVAEPDDLLVGILRRAPFVVLPSGTLDSSDDRRFIAQLSFPSRIPYILATSHTPILVLGSAATAAAQIVKRLGIGMVAAYGRSEFLDAVERILRPDVNLAMRRAAFVASNRFADRGAADWLWDSLAKGEPVDRRYEDLRAQLTA